MMDLNQPCTQAEFAQLVGISQPAVSELVSRGVLGSGQRACTWLLAYTAQLREAAAGRGADGELAQNRAAESATRNQLLKLKLSKARGESVDVSTVAMVLAAIGAQIASRLEPLPARIKMLVPELSAERLKQIDAIITEARNAAASAGLSVLDMPDPTGDIDEKVSA